MKTRSLLSLAAAPLLLSSFAHAAEGDWGHKRFPTNVPGVVLQIDYQKVPVKNPNARRGEPIAYKAKNLHMNLVDPQGRKVTIPTQKKALQVGDVQLRTYVQEGTQPAYASARFTAPMRISQSALYGRHGNANLVEEGLMHEGGRPPVPVKTMGYGIPANAPGRTVYMATDIVTVDGKQVTLPNGKAFEFQLD
jgi:hypothetical protein